MLNKVMSAIGKFCYKFKYVVCVVFVILFAGVCYLQSQTIIAFSNNTETNKVTDIFPEDDTIVVVYANADEQNIPQMLSYLSENEHVTSIQCYANTLGLKMSPQAMAQAIGMDTAFINTLYYVHENGTDTDGLTLTEFINFISSETILGNDMFSGMIDEQTKSMLTQYSSMINGIAADTAYTAPELAAIFGMEQQQIEYIFAQANITNSTIDGFCDIIIARDPTNTQIQTMKGMCQAVKGNVKLTPAQLAQSLPIDPTIFNESTLSLMYLLYYGNTTDMSAVEIALYDFFQFICNDIAENEQFKLFLTEEYLALLDENKSIMDDGKAQLVGKDNSRLIFTVDYELETKEINEFYDNLTTKSDELLKGGYYLVGNSAMSYELSQSFDTEYLIISIVIAVAIFLIVCITFRKFSIPAFLVLLIECAVFMSMSVMTLMKLPMYFIALLIVQSILMGSTVDYGILLTSYYREVRKNTEKENALSEVLKRSASAILTSALIMIGVTFILGAAMSGAVGSILTVIGTGTLSATILVIFVLPSLLSIFDKFVIIKNKKPKGGKPNNKLDNEQPVENA